MTTALIKCVLDADGGGRYRRKMAGKRATALPGGGKGGPEGLAALDELLARIADLPDSQRAAVLEGSDRLTDRALTAAASAARTNTIAGEFATTTSATGGASSKPFSIVEKAEAAAARLQAIASGGKPRPKLAGLARRGAEAVRAVGGMISEAEARELAAANIRARITKLNASLRVLRRQKAGKEEIATELAVLKTCKLELKKLSEEEEVGGGSSSSSGSRSAPSRTGSRCEVRGHRRACRWEARRPRPG